jgi:hypothetical protein
MATPSRTLVFKPDTDPYRKLVRAITSRIDLGIKGQQDQQALWQKAEDSVLAYVPESALDARRRNRRENQGEPTYTTIKIPYSFALLMSAHTYWTSVFFARSPVHQYSGRHGEGEQQIQAVEALIAYQIDVGGAMAPYYIWMYDAGKYGIGILGTYWDEEVVRYSTLEMPDPESGESGKLLITNEVRGFTGSRCYNVSPWDFFPDPRVPVLTFQKGEFVAIRKRLPWNELKRRERQGYYVNLDHLSRSRGSPNLGPSTAKSTLRRPEDLALADMTMAEVGDTDDQKRHPAMIEAFEVYIDLIPSEWKLSDSDYPEKWVFTLTSDRRTLLGVTPLGYAHGQFPFDILPGEVEGYGSWMRGLPQTMAPIQDTMDWLVNTHFFNVRAAMNNLFVADPTRVVMKDIEHAEAGGIIRLKAEAYGSDVRTALTQLPIQDITRGHMTDVQAMLGVGERISGINDQIMGVLNTGGRKTATEVRTSTGFGVNRQKTVTEYMSAVGFTPHSQRLVQCSQQYYSTQLKLRIVGDIATQDGGRFAMVSPEDIAGFYDFVPVDGTLPVDRMAQANLWTQVMQAMRQFPEVGMRFDFSKIFGWIALLGGVRNLNQFKRPPQTQVMPDEALAQQAQRGNLVPIRPNVALPQRDNRQTGLPPELPIGSSS